jgi:large subunit ribosomal protein L25
MANVVLKLEERMSGSAGKLKRLRAEGYVPGVIYGKSIESKSIKVKASDLRSLLSAYGRTALISATFENGESIPALIKDIQYEILKDQYLSLDLHQVSMTEKVRTSVPIRIIGRESVERNEGVVSQQLDSIEVECLPQDTPQYIELDISDMIIGQNLTAGGLNIPDEVTLLTEPDQLVLSIITSMPEDIGEIEETEELDISASDDSGELLDSESEQAEENE